MAQAKAELLILCITLFWGSSYLFMKIGLDSLGEFNLIALRFGIAFVLTAAIFFRRLKALDRQVIKHAFSLGTIVFGIFVCILFSLKTTGTANASFLVGLKVIFVPLLQALAYRKNPDGKVIIGAAFALSGIGLLTLKAGLALQPGDLFCLLAAVLCAVQLICTDAAVKETDALSLGILQLGVTAVWGLAGALLFETPALPQTTSGWLAILALGLLCSAFGFVLQPVAQQYTTPDRAALIFTLEPVCAALFACLFLGERLDGSGLAGALLVLTGVGVVLAGANPGKKHADEKCA